MIPFPVKQISGLQPLSPSDREASTAAYNIVMWAQFLRYHGKYHKLMYDDASDRMQDVEPQNVPKRKMSHFGDTLRFGTFAALHL